MPETHKKCRGGSYQRNAQVVRFQVPDNLVGWNISWPAYNPQEFTNNRVLAGPEWADPDVSGIYPSSLPRKTKELNFNEIDEKVNRKSHTGKYEIIGGLPMYANFK